MVSLWQRFEQIAQSGKTQNLFGDIDGCWTRRESLSAVYSIALKIESVAGNLSADSIIAIHLPRDRRYLATMFSIWLRGNTILPLNAEWPQIHTEQILAHSRANLVITYDSVNEYDFKGIQVIRLPAIDKIASLPTPDLNILKKWKASRAEESLAYIMYTSGSTGEQKGVCISHHAIEAYTGWVHNYWSDHEYTALLISAELTFDLSMGDIAFALAHDVEIHLSPQAGNIFSHAFLLVDRAIDVFYSVPSTLSRFFRLCRERDDVSAKNLSLIISGGDVVSPNLVSEIIELAPQAMFYNVYGPTEMTINCLATRVDNRIESIKEMNLVPIGYPFSHLQTQLYPQESGDYEGWMKGELLVSGAQSMEGYYQDKKQTEKAFIRLKGKKYYRTGDMVTYNRDGLYYYLGRMDTLVKINGYRVNPVSIDNLLLTESAVKECKTIPANIEGSGLKLYSFVVISEKTNPEKLMLKCRRLLPEYACPEKINVLPELPLGKSGKHDTKKLQTLLVEKRS